MDRIFTARPIVWFKNCRMEAMRCPFKSRVDSIGRAGPAAVVFVFILLSD